MSESADTKDSYFFTGIDNPNPTVRERIFMLLEISRNLAIRIWPSIYSFINAVLFRLIKIIRAFIRLAARQIGL